MGADSLGLGLYRPSTHGSEVESARTIVNTRSDPSDER
jgi:hypothetical protein